MIAARALLTEAGVRLLAVPAKPAGWWYLREFRILLINYSGGGGATLALDLSKAKGSAWQDGPWRAADAWDYRFVFVDQASYELVRCWAAHLETEAR